MTPIEALVQIARKVEQDPTAHLNELATLARSGLRHSGEHGLLFVRPGLLVRTIYCYCGWEWHSSGGLLTADEIIWGHIIALEVKA